MLPQFSTTAAAQRQEEGRLRRLEDKALRAAMRESAKYAPTPSSPPVASPPTKTKLYLILLVWISIYSGWNIIGRNVSQEGPVLRLLILNCLRALVASIITLILMVCMQEPWPDLNPKDTVKWLALGIVTCVMNNVYTLGLRWTTATNVAIFIATTPLWTYLGGVCVGMEVLDTRWKFRAVGFMLAVMGAMVVQLGRAQTAVHMGQSKFFHFFGNIVVLFAVCSISAYYLVVRSLASSNNSALAITLVAQCSALVYSLGFIVLTLAAEEEIVLNNPNATSTSWGSMLTRLELTNTVLYSGIYAGICINVVCFGIEAWALKHATPGTVALFSALDPPFTAILSIVFLHETPKLSLGIGGLLIVGGLFVNAGVEEYTEKEKRKKESKKWRDGVRNEAGDFEESRLLLN